jgi:G3E family GTPase
LPQWPGRETIADRGDGTGMDEAETLPITVLTGFLGSGKTTLLRRALTAPSLADTAVVINEIGEIGIDHHLVDYVEGGVVELPGGCLCCALREDLARTLRDLLARRVAGAVRRFRRLVVETTGLADPAPILYTLGADALLDHALAPARVVTVVDAVAGAASLGRFPEAARQAALADAVVVSKTDLVPFGRDLAARLAALNPAAPRFLATDLADPGTVLFGSENSPLPRPLPRAGEGVRAADGWGPSAAAAHSHGIDAFAVRLDGPMSRLDFARALGRLAAARGSDLLRVKGIVEFADRPGRPALVQAAQHTLFAPEWLELWPAEWPAAARHGRLVFIVHEIPRPEVLGHFAFARPSLWRQPS